MYADRYWVLISYVIDLMLQWFWDKTVLLISK